MRQITSLARSIFSIRSLGTISIVSLFSLTTHAACIQAGCDRYNFEVPVTILNSTNSPALITTGGNVGFGTQTPLQMLHVLGSARLEAESPNGTFIDFVISNATPGFTTTRLGTSEGGDFIVQSVDDSYLNPVTKMVISRSGKVGIGTESPARALHIQTEDGLRLSPSSAPSSPAAGDVIVDSDDSNILKYYNGSAWVNAGSSGGGGGSGSVTSISTGTGLTGGPITTTGTISIAPGGVGTTEIADNQVTDAKISAVGIGKISSGSGLYLTYKPDNIACTAGQVLKWQNSRWECGDDDGGGTSPLLAKGDLFVHNGTSATRLAVGTNGQVLKADSSETTGLAWGPAVASELSSLVTTGIVQRNGSESFSTVTVAAPLSYTGGTLGLDTGSGGLLMDGGNNTSGNMVVGPTSNHNLILQANNHSSLVIGKNGNVLIGSGEEVGSSYKLEVKGSMGVQESFSLYNMVIIGLPPFSPYRTAMIRSEAIGGSPNFKGRLNFELANGETFPPVSTAMTLEEDNASLLVPTYVRHASDDSQGSVLYGSKSRGSLFSPTAVQSGDTLLSISGSGYNGSSYKDAAQIIFKATQNFNGSGAGGSLSFVTTPLNTLTPTERLVINSDGQVGIGVASPSYILHINGQGRSTSTAWATTSDIRLKDLQGDFQYGLKEIQKLDTVWFNYKKDNPLGLPSNERHAGVVAQEVQTVIPEAINQGKDGYLTLNMDPIHWASINAIKEIAAKQVESEAEIETLRAQNKALLHYICSKDGKANFCR